MDTVVARVEWNGKKKREERREEKRREERWG
jgi:hypothetical protein